MTELQQRWEKSRLLSASAKIKEFNKAGLRVVHMSVNDHHVYFIVEPASSVHTQVNVVR